MIHFNLQKRSPLSYYEQIRIQLILHMLSSNVRDRDKLPTIRETARALRINPNTVFKIYQRLQRDGFIELRQGSGAYVRASWRDTLPSNADLVKFVSLVLAEAHDKFHLAPQQFAHMLYRYVMRSGEKYHTCIVVNDDETMTIDANVLSKHFAARFVPVHIRELEKPTASLQGIIGRSSAFITTMYHIEQMASVATRFKKPLLEIRRDPTFITDVLQASQQNKVAVVFQQKITRDHFRDLVFKKLFPEAVRNLSFLAIEQRRELHRALKGKCLIYVSPLVYGVVRAMVPPQREIVEIKGWVSTQSLEHMRAILLRLENKASG